MKRPFINSGAPYVIADLAGVSFDSPRRAESVLSEHHKPGPRIVAGEDYDARYGSGRDTAKSSDMNKRESQEGTTMFLSRLNNREKNIFMSLALAVARADGIVLDSEKRMLSDYASEMGLSLENPVPEKNFEALLAEINETSSDQTKRIIYVELRALANVDENIAVEEKTLLYSLEQAFCFDKKTISLCINLLDNYIFACKNLIKFIEIIE